MGLNTIVSSRPTYCRGERQSNRKSKSLAEKVPGHSGFWSCEETCKQDNRLAVVLQLKLEIRVLK